MAITQMQQPGSNGGASAQIAQLNKDIQGMISLQQNKRQIDLMQKEQKYTQGTGLQNKLIENYGSLWRSAQEAPSALMQSLVLQGMTQNDAMKFMKEIQNSTPSMTDQYVTAMTTASWNKVHGDSTQFDMAMANINDPSIDTSAWVQGFDYTTPALGGVSGDKPRTNVKIPMPPSNDDDEVDDGDDDDKPPKTNAPMPDFDYYNISSPSANVDTSTKNVTTSDLYADVEAQAQIMGKPDELNEYIIKPDTSFKRIQGTPPSHPASQMAPPEVAPGDAESLEKASRGNTAPVKVDTSDYSMNTVDENFTESLRKELAAVRNGKAAPNAFTVGVDLSTPEGSYTNLMTVMEEGKAKAGQPDRPEGITGADVDKTLRTGDVGNAMEVVSAIVEKVENFNSGEIKANVAKAASKMEAETTKALGDVGKFIQSLKPKEKDILTEKTYEVASKSGYTMNNEEAKNFWEAYGQMPLSARMNYNPIGEKAAQDALASQIALKNANISLENARTMRFNALTSRINTELAAQQQMLATQAGETGMMGAYDAGKVQWEAHQEDRSEAYKKFYENLGDNKGESKKDIVEFESKMAIADSEFIKNNTFAALYQGYLANDLSVTLGYLGAPSTLIDSVQTHTEKYGFFNLRSYEAAGGKFDDKDLEILQTALAGLTGYATMQTLAKQGQIRVNSTEGQPTGDTVDIK